MFTCRLQQRDLDTQYRQPICMQTISTVYKFVFTASHSFWQLLHKFPPLESFVCNEIHTLGICLNFDGQILNQSMSELFFIFAVCGHLVIVKIGGFDLSKLDGMNVLFHWQQLTKLNIIPLRIAQNNFGQVGNLIYSFSFILVYEITLRSLSKCGEVVCACDIYTGIVYQRILIAVYDTLVMPQKSIHYFLFLSNRKVMEKCRTRAAEMDWTAISIQCKWGKSFRMITSDS